MTNVTLWLSVIWIVPLMYALMVNEKKFKKNITVGVTLPYEGREDPEVLACLRTYKKRLGLACGILIAAAVLASLVKDMSRATTLLLTWVDMVLIFTAIPYVLCNRELKAIKARKGWRRENPQVVTVDTGVILPRNDLSIWWFLPAVVVSLLPLAWEKSLWMLYIIDAVCVVLFWMCYRWAYRNKAERVDNDAELTRILTLARRQSWGKLWLIAAWLMPLMVLGMSLTLEKPLWMAGIFLLLFVGVLAAMLHIEFSLRKLQERLTAQSGRDWYVDEDDLWIGGMFYYNPNDSRLVINQRVGTNSTVNLAKPAGKALMLLVALMLLALPFMGVLMSGDNAMVMEMSDTALVATCGAREYVVEREDILTVELRETLPKGLSRTMGTGLPNLLKGKFSAPGLGVMNVCLDPTSPPFLLVETEEGARYLLGAREETIVRDIYEQLK